MKIAFFVVSFPIISETFIVNQIVGLLNAGHQIFIYAQTKAVSNVLHPVIDEYLLLDKTIFLEDIPKNRQKKIWILTRGFLKRPYFLGKWVLRFLNKNNVGLSVYNILPFLESPKFDVVHAHFGNMGNYVTQLRTAGLFSGAKFITTFHGYDMMVKPSVYTRLFATDVTITVNSEYSKKQLLKLDCPEQKINILPVGLDTNYFKRKHKTDQIFTLLFVGRLVAVKGPDIFLKICKKLANKNQLKFKAVMIGDGEMSEELEKQLDALELNGIVELAGSKNQEEIKWYMENADVLVLPGISDNGRAETQGLVIQEAQAMQLPVVVSDAGGMKEGVLNGITGYVLPENNTQAFVEKVHLLAANNELKEKMGEAGRKMVMEEYDIIKLNTKLLELYHEDKI